MARMDDRVLETLLQDLEAPSSERKASLADKDRVCQAICAFANDVTSSGQPGYISIGANKPTNAGDLLLGKDSR